MSWKSEILARFSGEGEGRPFYLPDLTLWYDWHTGQGTLPAEWQGFSLPQICRELGVPVWWPVRPWRLETPGVPVIKTEENGERIIRADAPSGTLIARWMQMPDGDWWQTEYPVTGEEALPAALELAQARSYVLDTARLAELEAQDLGELSRAVGDDGVLVLEIPRRPMSDILHEMLGWSDGLMLLGHPLVQQINAVLEDKLQSLVEQVAQLPGDLVLSPDNLDGQFISPRLFKKNLADSYRRTAEALHQQHKRLVVHVGGPVRHILAALAEAGVDGVEGIAGPPQGDVSLAQAREIAGPDLTLWGGIPQDYLPDTRDFEELEAAVRQATQESRGDARMILGVADRVPAQADLGRLRAIPSLMGM